MTTAHPVKIEQVRVSDIKENPLNREIFNEISKEQYEALLEYIKTCGLLKPLCINSKNILLAGHERLRIVKELGHVTVQCQRMDFTDASQEAEFMIKDNILSRVLSPIETARAGLHLEQHSKKYQRRGGPLRDVIANSLGISTAQYEKSKAILASENQDLIKRVDRGEVSVAKAYSMLSQARQRAEAKSNRTASDAPRFKLVNEDPLQVIGNFRPESCDCVISEPPFGSNPVWIDLVKRALKENGSLFIVTQRNFPAIADAMEAGLKLVVPICTLTRTHQDGSFVYNHLQVAWLAKNGKGKSGGRDQKVSTIWDFRTSQDPMCDLFKRMIELATDRGDIVVHMFGDNRSISDLADLLGRHIFAIQPDRESFLREKLNV